MDTENSASEEEILTNQRRGYFIGQRRNRNRREIEKMEIALGVLIEENKNNSAFYCQCYTRYTVIIPCIVKYL